jgi:hypothetical protein
MLRIRAGWSDGMAPFVACAGVLLFVGILAFLAELQTPSFVQWTGIEVHGDTYGGVTTYSYRGASYSIDNLAVSADDERHLPTTVWLSRWHPTDPDRAFIESGLERWTDFAFVAGWFFAAVLVLLIGRVRLLVRRRRRNTDMLQRTFGTGLDPELVQRLLDERRQPPRRTS